MSSMTPCTLPCPRCGHEQELEVWQSLNVTLDPELKDRLRAGEINAFTCAQCGHRAIYDEPILYHDMQLRFCVQYLPPGRAEDPEFLRGLTPEGTLPAADDDLMQALAEMQYLLRPHIVLSLDELVAYVAFRDRLAAAHGLA